MYKLVSMMVIFGISSLSFAQDLKTELLTCAAESDNAKRLGCYDALAIQEKPSEAKLVAATTPKNPVSTSQPTAPTVSAQEQPIAVEKAPTVAQQNQSQPLPTSAAKPTKPKLVAQASETPKPPTNTQPPVQVNDDAEQRFGYEHTQAPKGMLEKLSLPVSKVNKTPFGRMVITLENGQVWRQSDKVRLKIKPGQNVTIERGVLGSFFMSTDQVKKSIRVKRVK
ncbi:hypothetical protein [Paraglaciecola aestuariivivens]